jgi:hypothetical protein
MRISRTCAALFIVALAPVIARGQGSSAMPSVIAYDAELAKAASVAHAPMKAGGVEWTCTTTRCGGRGPSKDPLSTCKALVGQVGALKSFTAGGRPVDLQACGAVAAIAMAAVPVRASVPVPIAKPIPGVVPAGVPPPAPASAPPKKSSAPSGGLAWTAAAMTLTGTGSSGPPSSFKPIAWTAAPMALTGTGVAPVTRTTSLTWTADTMKLTGHP